jgi:hypothetical protein
MRRSLEKWIEDEHKLLLRQEVLFWTKIMKKVLDIPPPDLKKLSNFELTMMLGWCEILKAWNPIILKEFRERFKD